MHGRDRSRTTNIIMPIVHRIWLATANTRKHTYEIRVFRYSRLDSGLAVKWYTFNSIFNAVHFRFCVSIVYDRYPQCFCCFSVLLYIYSEKRGRMGVLRHSPIISHSIQFSAVGRNKKPILVAVAPCTHAQEDNIFSCKPIEIKMQYIFDFRFSMKQLTGGLIYYLYHKMFFSLQYWKASRANTNTKTCNSIKKKLNFFKQIMFRTM